MSDGTTNRPGFFSQHAMPFVGWILFIGISQVVAISPASLAETPPSPPKKNLASTSQPSKIATRKFVKKWKVKDLQRDLHLLGEGRSYKNGKKLFKVASCVQCHRLNKEGGTLGPDLTGVAGRNSRVVILREILEPSKKIPAVYQSHILLTSAGKTYSGLVVRQDANFIYLANDPDKPEQLREIARDDLEEQTLSTVSIMPEDLLNTLSKEEILDLLAYIEAGGQEDHPAFDPIDEHLRTSR